MREGFQRDQIILGLKHCKDNDIILISDADEFLHHDAIARVKNALNDSWIVKCDQRHFKFFLNMETSISWIGTLATRYKDLKNEKIDKLRKSYSHNIPPPSKPCVIIENAGWHFSSMGGLDRFVQKLEAFAHTAQNTSAIANTPDIKEQSHIDRFLKDLCHPVEIDHSFPWFISENVEYFREKGFIY